MKSSLNGLWAKLSGFTTHFDITSILLDVILLQKSFNALFLLSGIIPLGSVYCSYYINMAFNVCFKKDGKWKKFRCYVYKWISKIKLRLHRKLEIIEQKFWTFIFWKVHYFQFKTFVDGSCWDLQMSLGSAKCIFICCDRVIFFLQFHWNAKHHF